MKEQIKSGKPATLVCHAAGISRSTYYRHTTEKKTAGLKKSDRKPHPRALSPTEKEAVMQVIHEDRFIDKAPNQIFAKLLDEGKYYCCIRTYYRLLAAANEVRERRNTKRHKAYEKPELIATAPNQVWSWDISKCAPRPLAWGAHMSGMQNENEGGENSNYIALLHAAVRA
jgi:putative transposase